MKKFKFIFTFLFCIMAIGTFYGCGQKVELSFNQQIIEMVKGEVLDVEDFLQITNGYIDNVTFSSTDENVAIVTPDFKFGAVGAGQAVIKATVGEESVNVTIKVYSEVISLDSPQALRYDSTQNAIVWNAVYGKLDGEIFVANSYTVWCQKAGEEPEIFDNILSPKFEIEDEGEYLVKVKTNARSEYILGSDYCEAIVVTKLSAPTNLVFDEATSTLAWEGNAENYEVNVNGVRTKANGKSIKLDLTDAGEYNISVIALDQNISNCIEAESETLRLTRLASPTLSVNNGRLTWNNQNGVSDYELTISKSGNPDRVEHIAGNVNSYALQGLSNGEYKVSIVANGQNGYLTSKQSNEVSAIKLASVTLSFDKNTKTLKVLENITNDVKVNVSYNDKIDTITLNSQNNYSYSWNYEQPTTYTLTATVSEKNNNEIVSDYSNEITIIQLAKSSTVEHSINENKSYIKFASVEQANHYEIEVYKDSTSETTGLKTIEEFDADGYELGITDEIFSDAGDYRIIVSASNTTQNEEGTYILDSQQELSIIRLANVANVTYNSDNKIITWDNVANKISYKYEFIKDGKSYIKDVITVMDSYEVSSFDFGEYTFKIKAIGNGATILDSIDYGAVNFDIEKILESPLLTFNRENASLTLNSVENASEYILSLNNNEIALIQEFEGQKTIDVSNYVSASGEYTFKVKAYNKQNKLLLDSVDDSRSTVIVTRLSAPTKITLNENETITVPEYKDTTILSKDMVTININEKDASKLGTEENFTVKVKYNAKTENVQNKYYLDSPYSTFTVERLSTPKAPKFENQFIVWELIDSELEYDCKLEFIQDGISHVIINNNKKQSFNPNNLFKTTLDLSREFTVRLIYGLGESEITDKGYASSLPSEEKILSRLGIVDNLKVIGTNSKPTISWSEVTNAEYYILTIISPTNVTFKQELEATSYNEYEFKEVGEYKISVQAKNKDCLDSMLLPSITVERLANPTTVNVSNAENLSINDRPNSEKLEKVKVEISQDDNAYEVNGDINLESINGSFDVVVQYVAKQMQNGNKYYISSDSVTYKFARISKMQDVTLSENYIKWTPTEDADGYELQFTKVGKETKTVKITDKSIGSIALGNSNIKDILEYFGTGSFNVGIRAIKNEIKNLESGVVGYLSCKDYSNLTQIKKLVQPTDVKVTSEDGDIEQTKLTVSWEHSDFTNEQKYNIICGKEIVATVVGLKEITLENKFVESGNYTLCVQAIGTGNNLTSDVSEAYSFKRLTVPTGINVDRQAILSWQNISGAISYQLYYQLPNESGLNMEVTNPADLSSILLRSLELIEGITTVSIRAIGNGADTFSSACSTVYNVDVLKKPTIVLGPNHFSINGSYGPEKNVVAKVTIQNENGDIIVVDNQNYNLGQKSPYPQLSAGKYIITAYAQSLNLTGYVNSMVVSQEFVKLEAPTDLHFTRTTLENNNDYISFRAKTIENASGYSFTVNDNTQTEYKTVEGNETYLTYDFTSNSNLENKLQVGQNTFEIFSIGGKIGDVYYINSDKVSITATMLNQISDIKTENGKLVWENDSKTVKYKVSINGVYEDLDSKENAEKLLEKYNDELSINIKSLGNVTNAKCNENILLDSRYMGTLENEVFTPKNYDCKKLVAPTYFAVNEGYIAVNKPDNNIKYEIHCGEDIFTDLITVKEDKSGEITYANLISNAMYEKLDAGEVYSIKIKFITEAENTINSNLSNEIKIVIPNAIEKVDWNLRLKSAGEQNYYDLADTYLGWEDIQTGNGYVAYVNGELTYLDVHEFKPTDLEKEFTFKVGIKGASNTDTNGAYILNSKLTEEKVYFILSTPTVSVKDGIITWTKVENATGYYVYLNGNVYSNTALNSLELNVYGPGEYEIAVQAVSMTKDYFAGKKAFYTVEGTEENISVEKLLAPNKFLIENGRLYWAEGLDGLANFDLSSVIGLPLDEIKEKFLEETSVKSPFTYNLENIGEQTLVLSFRNGVAQYDVKIEAGYFLTPTTEQMNLLETIASSVGMTAEYNELAQYVYDPSGWPTHLQLFDEFAGSVPSGEYNLFVRQNGNDYDYLNSGFNDSINVYVPGAPKTNITFEDDCYILNWNAITLPTKFSDGATKYTIFGDKGDEEKIIIAKDRTETKLNLTQLIENGKLTSDFTKIYVVVQGNNKGALNGKTSNKIEIEVLTEVKASVVEGVLTWNSQSSATAYEIVYKGGALNNESIIKTTDNFWLGEELEEGYAYEDVTIKALGTELQQVLKFVLAGPVTNIGKLEKIEQPDWYIEDGIIKWEDIENSSKYTAINYKDLVENAENEFDGDHTIVKDDLLSFVTTLTGNITYFLKSIGTLELLLNNETTAYINSNYTNPIYTYRHAEIEGVECNAGEVVWKFLQYNDKNIQNYILTFHREGNADIVIDLQQRNQAKYDGYSDPYQYGEEEFTKLIADTFALTIEGYAKGNSTATSGNDENFTLTNNGKEVYVLRSVPQEQPYTVTKLAKPENVDVSNGKVVWQDTSSDEESIFELVFTREDSAKTHIRNSDEDRKSEFEYDHDNGVWTWSGVVNNNMDNFDISTYRELNIRRLSTNEHELNSDYAEYREIRDGLEGDYNTIIQLNAIKDKIEDTFVSIDTKNIDGVDKYVISWEGYTPGNALSETKISYLFEYRTESQASGITSAIKQIIVPGDQKYVIYDELTQAEGTDSLVYSIQVLAGNEFDASENGELPNYLNSRKTRDFTIKKPTSVKNIVFNTVSQTFEWEYANDEQNNDLEFVITDYLISGNSHITDVTSIENYPKSTYKIAVKTGENAYSYAPLAVGLHVVSIEVSVSNIGASDDNVFKSGAVYYTNSEDGRYSETMNLFKEGDGITKPYIVSTPEQFDNIRYRSEVLSYIQKPLEFKQNAHLTINASISENESGETVYDGFINKTFDAIYDGDYYSLTVNVTLDDLAKVGGLFSEIGENGQIKNLHILTSLKDSEIDTEIKTGLIAKTNNGTISNILVGDSSKTIGFTAKASIQFSLAVHTNNGTIEKMVNNYNISLKDDDGINYSAINFGVIAYKNSGTIKQCGNKGTITIDAREGANIGGITAVMDAGSVTDCYNNAGITISYNSDTGTYYVGGIVGNINVSNNNTGGNIYNCYSLRKFVVSHNNTNPKVYIGGLVGYASNAKHINNSYSNIDLEIDAVTGITLSAEIKVLVGSTEVNSKENTTCYSTKADNLAGGSGLKYETLTWADILTKLNANDGSEGNVFVADENNNPKFTWENTFNDNQWQENK